MPCTTDPGLSSRSASDLGCDPEQVSRPRDFSGPNQDFGVVSRWKYWQLEQGGEPSTVCSRATCCPSVQGRVCDDCRAHVEPGLLGGESSEPLREWEAGKKAELKFHQAHTEPAPWSPRAFVPLNQYVIKLKSQLKNFQWC